MFAIVYSQKNQTLYVLPLRLSSNDGSAYPTAAFLKGQGVTQAAIREWLKQNFLDKIVTRWLVVNGKKSRFTLHNLGKIHFENHLCDGFSIQ